jgi:hypothetical protein
MPVEALPTPSSTSPTAASDFVIASEAAGE